MCSMQIIIETIRLHSKYEVSLGRDLRHERDGRRDNVMGNARTL